MRKRICGLLTALALCLALLPGTALAADGVVTISGRFGAGKVVLKPEKFYVSDDNLGVAERDTAPEDGNYLTYADGVLTVSERGSERGIDIPGSMSLGGNLEICGGGLSLRAFTETALSLNGHTLTMDHSLFVSSESGSVAVSGGGGTICFPSNSSSSLEIRNSGGLAVQNLTIQNAAGVRIDGYSDSGGVVQNLTVKNSEVTISQVNPGNPTIVEAGQITTEDGGKFWAFGGKAPTDDPYFLDKVSLPTFWSTENNGNFGSMYYEPPAAAGGAATLTLTNATYQEQLEVQNNPVQVVLEGTNELANFSAGKVTLTGDGSFTGKISTLEGGFTNHATGEVNAVVEEATLDASGVPNGCSFTVYGERSITDLTAPVVATTAPLTIEQGATLTVPEGEEMTIFAPECLTNRGTLKNEGTITLLVAEGDDPAEVIKNLGLTGSGTVGVFEVLGEGPDSELRPAGTYTNAGKRLLDPAETLDFSDPNTPSESSAQGYSWDAATKTLTLQEGFSAKEVYLPDDTVTVVTEGESAIDELSISGGSPQKTALTLSGPGPLTIKGTLNLSDGDNTNNSLTIERGAEVAVYNGVRTGVDGTVTVNGTLNAQTGYGAAIQTGKAFVGPSGTLELSGQIGMYLWGIQGDFRKAFELAPGGRVTSECWATTIQVDSTDHPFDESLKAGDILSIPSGYLPKDLEPRITNDREALILWAGGGRYEISVKNAPPAPPRPGHTHQWAEGWTTDSAHHWHACEASGCPVTADSGKDGYGEHVYDNSRDADCNVCGYRRSLPSSGSSGGSSGGGGSSSGGGGKTASLYPPEPPAEKKEPSCPLGAACSSLRFTDVKAGAWYHDATDFVLERGLMNGYGDGTFRPDGTLSRAMLAQILYNQAGRPAVAGGSAFPDVAAGAGYAPAIAWAAERGVVGGYGDGTFRPNGQITREQLAVMLWRYAGSPAPSGGSLRFPDAGQAGDYAREALAWAAESGVMSGYADGRLAPKGPVTRAQAAQLLKNFASHG